MNPNRELHELFGLCWHKPLYPNSHICTHCGLVFEGNMEDWNPNYAADPRLVLKEMDKHPKAKLFYAWLMYRENAEYIYDDGLIRRDYMTDTTGLLRDDAIEFLKGEGR